MSDWRADRLDMRLGRWLETERLSRAKRRLGARLFGLYHLISVPSIAGVHGTRTLRPAYLYKPRCAQKRSVMPLVVRMVPRAGGGGLAIRGLVSRRSRCPPGPASSCDRDIGRPEAGRGAARAAATKDGLSSGCRPTGRSPTVETSQRRQRGKYVSETACTR